jgi:hypothetical protein
MVSNKIYKETGKYLAPIILNKLITYRRGGLQTLKTFEHIEELTQTLVTFYLEPDLYRK